MPVFVSSPFPLSRSAFPTLRVAGCPVRVSLILARWYANPCGLCARLAWSGCPSGNPRVSFAFVCPRALAASAPFLPPRVGVARALRVALVQGTSRAVQFGPCPSAVPASVPCAVWLAWGGGSPSRFPHAWLELVGPFSGGSVRPGLEGSRRGGCVLSSPGEWPAGPEGRGRSTSVRPSAFPGRAPKRVLSVSLSSWWAWPPYCCGSCSRVDPGCGPRGDLVCWRGSASLSWSL